MVLTVDPRLKELPDPISDWPEQPTIQLILKKSAAGLEEVSEDEAARVLEVLDAHFKKEGSFRPDNSKVQLMPYGFSNRVYRIERSDGEVLVGFKMQPILRFPALDRNHFRFEQKQDAALAAGVLPENWKRLSFLDRREVKSKFYQDEKGDYWRFMPYVEGRVIQAIDEIPADKRLAAMKRFGKRLVQFRQMLEMEVGGTFEDTLPNHQNTAYRLDYYDRILAREKLEPPMTEQGDLPLVSIQRDRLEGSDEHGDLAVRNQVFQRKVARYRTVLGSVLGRLQRVVVHGDPRMNNIFWEIDQAGEWIPVAMGDLDYLQFGHEMLDLSDALRSLSFMGAENADPEHLVIFRDVVEALTEGWLEGIEAAYGRGERDRLEPYVYLSVAAIHFTLAIRFYNSFLTGDSHFERLTRYGKKVSDPGRFLRFAEVQMAQAEAFMREFSDKPGMAELAQLAAGLEEAQRLSRLQKWLARPEVTGGKGIRARTLTGIGKKSYDALALEQAPSELVPELKDGLSLFLEALNAQGRFTWVDAAGGLGAALMQAGLLFPNLSGLLVDAVQWTEKDFDPAVLRELRAQASEVGVDLLDRRPPFLQGNVQQVDLGSYHNPPIRLITMLNALAYNEDPLAVVANLYNQLDPGGVLLTNLYIPAGHAKAAELVKFYERLLQHLKAQGVEADFRIRDFRALKKGQFTAEGEEGPFPEYGVGMVLRKQGDQRLQVIRQPESELFAIETVRVVTYQVAWYGEDPAQVIRVISTAAGLEEPAVRVEEGIADVRGIPSRLERWTLDAGRMRSANVPDGVQVYYEPGLLPAVLEEAVRGQWNGQPLSALVLEGLKARLQQAAPGRAQALLIVNPETAGEELNALSWQAPVAIVAVVPGAIEETVSPAVFLSYLLEIVRRADDLGRVMVRLEAAGMEERNRAFIVDVAA
ncbi:MAG: aminoglycoside phosphotransferase family protein [Elusimicrobia bacterium]|nr:aminoglycoside phosphotransferase family protein [Elusimicrobiota bacterium]